MVVGELLAVFGVSRGREVGQLSRVLFGYLLRKTSASKRPRYARLCRDSILREQFIEFPTFLSNFCTYFQIDLILSNAQLSKAPRSGPVSIKMSGWEISGLRNSSASISATLARVSDLRDM